MAPNGDKTKGIMAEINVTPFVDVMLVLLVIFMITAPLMLNGIKLTLPKTKKANPIKLTTSQIILSMVAGGEIYLGEKKILRQDVISSVKEALRVQGSDIIFIRADFSLTYGTVASLMSLLKNNGISNVALVTEIEQ